MDASERCAAVVVTYNSEATISKCLESLAASGIKHTVVIDNASSDSTRDRVPKEILVANDENKGFARAVNQGARLLPPEPDLLLLLNPDAWLTGDALHQLSTSLLRHEDAFAAAPRTLTPDGFVLPTAWRLPNSLLWLLMHLHLARPFPPAVRRRLFMSYYMPQSGPELVVGWVFGSCVLLRREVWESFGGFDETFFLFGEELDLFWRVAKHGWRVLFVPRAQVVHLAGHSAEAEFGPGGYDERRWATTREVCRRHMSRVHYLTWLAVQSLLERRQRRARARDQAL